ncbi:hypothetical protein [Pontibacter populi]|uniref:Tissue inhibitor of metalloproteinase n=1 Tax=Pontibacter populi TaxID=890055 RepID=A0ABV1RNJ0_9BACT
MNKLGCLILLVLLCCSHNSYACDCPTRKWSVKSVHNAIEYSDIIFIGERVINTRDENFEEKYSFKIIEAIKGNIKAGEIIHGKTHNSCSGSPNTKGLWIIYATLEDDGLIDYAYTGCGASRSLSGPYVPVPAPHLDNYEYYKEQTAKLYPEYLKEWQNEYILLQSFKNQHAEAAIGNKLNNRFLTYIAIITAIIALVIAILKK